MPIVDRINTRQVPPARRKGQPSRQVTCGTAVPHVALAFSLLASGASAQSGVIGWGLQVFDTRFQAESFVELAAGSSHTVARRADGTAVAWGNSFGGTCVVPPLPPGRVMVEVDAGYENSVARLDDGSLIVWGPSGHGITPTLPAGTTYVEVAVGFGHTAARRSDGSAVAWGFNAYGQCNVPMLPAGVGWIQIETGAHHTVGRRSDGMTEAWGANGVGQCNVPALAVGLVYEDVASGWAHTLALRSDGAVIAWGDNSALQCNVPALPPGLRYVQVAAGDAHSLALRSDGALLAWGANNDGQCNVPALAAGETFALIDAGESHSVALRGDGRPIAWGANRYSQCNAPAVNPGAVTDIDASHFNVARTTAGDLVQWASDVPAPPPAPAGVSYRQVSAGTDHAVALRSDDLVVAWGMNTFGQCTVPPPPAGERYVSVTATAVNSAALTSSGAIVVWGASSSGQLLVPPLPPGVTYVEVTGSGGVVLSGFPGGVFPWGFMVARRSDGSVVAWGDNQFGQANVPAFPAGVTVADLDSGPGFVLALTSDGNVWAWGDNSTGQLNVPPLPVGLQYTEISAGGFFSNNSLSGFALALRSDGVLVGWGDNGFGQAAPPVLRASERLAQVVAGTLHSVARVDDLSPSAFCSSGTTSIGCAPTLRTSGIASASAPSGFTLAAVQVPGQTLGLLFYSVDNAGFSPLPWSLGSGYLCLKPPLQRLPVGSSGGIVGMCNGSLSADWNAFRASHPACLGAPFAPGEHVYVQAWCRDPGNAPNTVLSNAVVFVLQP